MFLDMAMVNMDLVEKGLIDMTLIDIHTTLSRGLIRIIFMDLVPMDTFMTLSSEKMKNNC